MNIPNLALFRRTLLVDSRSFMTYAFRFVMAVLICFFLVQFQFSAIFSPLMLSAAGLRFFTAITYINLIFISFLGVTIFASVITEEKEINSLNLLLMAGLTPLGMLLSKSTSKLLIGIMLLLTQLPFTMIAVTLGGISQHQVFCAYITLFAYTFFVCNLALFSSVISSRSFNASSFASILLLLFIFFPGGNSYQISPFYRMFDILKSGYAGPLIGFQFYSNIILGILFFLCAILLFNRCSRKQTDEALTARPLVERKTRFKFLAVSRAWNSPFIWKEFYFTAGGKSGVIARLFLYPLVIISVGTIICFFGSVPQNPLTFIGWLIVIITLVFTGLDIALFVGKVFQYELQDRTLTSLILLPFTPERIFYLKLAGILPALIPAAFFLLCGLVLCYESLVVVNLWWLIIVPLLLLNYIVFLQLVAYFSITVRSGALAIASTVYIVSFFFTTIMGQVLILFGFVFFNSLIIRKLKKIAAL